MQRSSGRESQGRKEQSAKAQRREWSWCAQAAVVGKQLLSRRLGWVDKVSSSGATQAASPCQTELTVERILYLCQHST